jgi:isocitrate dehydrogenase kinase/phosphatase
MTSVQSPPIDHNSLSTRGAHAIKAAFDSYQTEFRAITRRACWRFENRDWHAVQQDAVARIDLYKEVIDRIVAEITAILGHNTTYKPIWTEMKRNYSGLIAGRDDFALAETFFNSVTRRIFATVGVDRNIEFVDSDFEAPPMEAHGPIYNTYPQPATTQRLIENILMDYPFNCGYQDIERDAKLIADEIDAHLPSVWGTQGIDAVEIVKPLFYRNKGAYIIGRIRRGDRIVPLLIPLLIREHGVFADAVLLTQDEASVVFSYTRSYFRVEVDRPYELIGFLKSIMPSKRVAELYISIGYNKHGKTELYRDLLRHLANSDDTFEIAPGDKGMVMTVFTLPSYDVVFKIIKDRFAYPKTTTRQDVMDKYQLVFKHDRAGRLVDAQEFEHLRFDRDRFSNELLEELLDAAAGSVTVEGSSVVIKHLYTERRMTPLNLYLREADPAAAGDAVLDYGQAVKDLAATNIFPGDMLLKNFGVTRHGRVVFYDYDELGLLDRCNFRDVPPTDDVYQEMGAEPWFYVGENDIFPEEFIRFLGLPAYLREAFLNAHGDLLTAAYWRQTQERHAAGEVIDLFPYKHSKRFPDNGP